MRIILAATALFLAASPGSASQKRDPVPAATPAGEPVDCLSLSAVRETKVRDGRTIDFYVGRKVYRNTLSHECPSLNVERRYAHKTSINQICSLDTITVLTGPGITRGASCGLGKFQPVTLAK